MMQSDAGSVKEKQTIINKRYLSTDEMEGNST